jgi:hypothetical protein
MGLSPNDERYQDIRENAEFILAHYKNLGNKEENDSREGRMIFQMKIILEALEAGKILLPVNRDFVASLSYITLDPDKHFPKREVTRLAYMLKDANYLMKPPYYNYIYRELDELVPLIEQSYPEVYSAVRAKQKKEADEFPDDEDILIYEEMLSDGLAAPDLEGTRAFRFMEDLLKIKKALQERSLKLPMLTKERREYFPFYGLFCRSLLLDGTPQQAIYDSVKRIDCMITDGIRPDPDGTLRGVFHKYKLIPLEPEKED